MMNAKGAAAILMDVHTGEILLASPRLPNFDPNDRPAIALTGDPSDSPLFNRAVQGVYELGSTFKIFAVAQAMDLGLVNRETLVDANAPMHWGKFKITELDNHNYGPTAVGHRHHREILQRRGRPYRPDDRRRAATGLPEVAGPAGRAPDRTGRGRQCPALLPKNWSDIVTITASYGHGISSSPLNLAAGLCHDCQWRHQGHADPAAHDNRTPGQRVISVRNGARPAWRCCAAW